MSSNKIKLTKKPLSYCSSKQSLEETGESPLKMLIDGHEVYFFSGDTIMQAAERASLALHIPRYCYHPGLSIAGSCRMCMVEVDKSAKLMTACSTPASPGMVVLTQSEKVKKARGGVMEFLLTNHPLDCPVCDQAGECDLQEYNFEYGPETSRFAEEKRVFPDKTTYPLSDKITLNMNRCINCERCVRFEEEITKTNDLLMVNRGWKKELVVTDEERGLTSDYQGCLADVCPVGALTSTDFRFKKRVWFLQKKASLCDLCSKGCNIVVHSDQGVIHRYTPIYNEQVNQHWICDEGRSSYHQVQNSERIILPTYPWPETVQKLKNALESANNICVVVGTDATLEEAQLFKEKLNQVALKSEITLRFYNGTNGVITSADNVPLDHLLRQKDKTPNTKGLESLGILPLSDKEIQNHKIDLAILFRNGRSAVPPVKAQHLFLWGVWNCQEVAQLSNVVAVIPGLATVEKTGTFINCDQITQTFQAAVTPIGNTLSVATIMGQLVGEGE